MSSSEGVTPVVQCGVTRYVSKYASSFSSMGRLPLGFAMLCFTVCTAFSLNHLWQDDMGLSVRTELRSLPKKL